MKYIKTILLSLLLIFLFTLPTLALDLGASDAADAAAKAGFDAANTNQTTFANVIGLVIKTVLSFVGVIFFALTVYAGYLWMTAHGEEEQAKKAQTIIKQSVIGLVITVAAYSITTLIVPNILASVTAK